MTDRQAALEQVGRVWEWLTGSAALSATNLGVELGLFDALQRLGPTRPASLAAVLGLQERPVMVWARVMIRERLLDVVDGDRVALAPGTDLLVCEPRTLLNLAPAVAFHARFLARDFLDLAAYFRDGIVRTPARHGPDLVANVGAQTAAMHTIFVTAILPELAAVRAQLTRGASVLDAGCGTGGLGLALASEFPAVRYLGLDLDASAVAIGRQRAEAAGVGDRVALEARDASAGAGEAGYDVAILFQALHEIAPASRPQVLQAIGRALKPGGHFILLDEFCPATLADAREDRARTAIHWDFCELLWGSELATSEEAEGLVRDAGLAECSWVPVLEGSMTILLARAP